MVWDINGNGKIDSNTEMMSEFDAEGNKVFQNGFEKLAHYFDNDNNGVIEGAELSELKFWVDDGDAKTEKGELRELSEFGIQRITIPKKGELTSTTTALKEQLIPPKAKQRHSSIFLPQDQSKILVMGRVFLVPVTFRYSISEERLLQSLC